MKLPIDSTNIQINGSIDEVNFDIGNPTIILEYLRKSIYKNPLKALCQEIMSNARDAHREVGKDYIPIHIKLPNIFNTQLIIEDYGPGITPKRMKDVFIKFGNSTKRGNDSNSTDDGDLQTGGFGIGAKTPWAYTDVFNIITRSYEDEGLVERTYSAIIGENRECKLLEINDCKKIIIEEGISTGTQIIVNINENDIKKCVNYIMKISYFWSVKPVLTGTDIPEIEDKEILFEGEGWSLYKSNHTYSNLESIALIDEIPYPINLYDVDYENIYQRGLLDSNLVIKFNVNEISVSLSREEIRYSDDTKHVIKNKLNEIYNEISNSVLSYIKDCDNLWDAKIKFLHFTNSLNNTIVECLKNLKVSFNNVEYDLNSMISVNFPSTIRHYKYQSHKNKFSTQSSQSFNIHSNSILIVNDVSKEYIPKHRLETLKNEYPNYEFLLINNLSKNKETYISLLKPINLSDIEPTIPEKIKSSKTGKTFKSKVFVLRYSDFWDSCGDIDLNDPNLLEENKYDGKFIYVPYYMKNSEIIPTKKVFKFQKIYNKKVYGISRRFITKLNKDKWISIFDVIEKEKEKILTDKTNIPYITLNTINYENSSYLFSNNFNIYKIFDKIKPKLKKDNFLIKWNELSNTLQVGTHKMYEKIKFLGLINENETINELKMFYDRFKNCKLFCICNSYELNNIINNDEGISDIVQYFNNK